MALSGLAQQWLRVFNDSITTTHLDAGQNEAPMQLANYRNYMWGDAADYMLGMTGGDTFDMRFNAAEGNHLKAINAGGTRSLTRTDNVDVMSQRLRKYYQDLMILDDEVEKNEMLMAYVEANRPDLFFQRLYKVRAAKEQERTITLSNDMEQITAGVPNFDKQENRSNQCEEATPFFAHVNEWKHGCFGITTATGFSGGSAGTDYNTAAVAAGGKWTTKQSVDPTLARFTLRNNVHVLSPTQESYSTIDNATTNHFTAMVRAERKSRYKRPPKVPNTMDAGVVEQSGSNADAVWYASDKGMDVIQATVLSSQDLWVTESRKDPKVYNPMVAGIELDWWEALDVAAIYPGSANTTLVTEGQGDRKGPRFYLHRRRTLYPVSHKLNWFRKRVPPRQMLVPDAHGEFLDVEWNWFCQHYPSQVCVYPSASIAALGSY